MIVSIVKTEPQKIQMPKMAKTGIRSQESESSTINPKHKARNPKQIQNPNIKWKSKM
jgi:hypothetical protein